jgi:hypothetical protein
VLISRSTDWIITHCDAAVSTDNGDNNFLGKGKIVNNFRDKGRSSDDIQGSDTKETTKKLDNELADNHLWRSPFRIEDTELFKHFCDNGNSRVDWVGDH